tara:strand:- start:733 stop:1131 length:399 start_codon:yes stop_codon:yes gene_type:complete
MGRPLNKKNFGPRADAAAEDGGGQWAPAAFTNQLYGDAHIVNQKGSKRFTVATTGQPNQVCTLVARTPTASGEVSIKVRDTDGGSGTYFVSKISGRTCTLVADTGTQFSDGVKVRWNRTGAEAGLSVLITLA